MRGVGFVHQEDANEQKKYNADRGVDHRGFAEFAVIHTHQGEHAEDSGNEPDGLAGEENVRVAILGVGGDGGGAEDHDRAEQTQNHGYPKEPFIRFQSSRHLPSLSCAGRRWAGGDCRALRQLVDQVFEDAAAVFVVFKLIQAGAGGREQNGVAGLGDLFGAVHGAFERFYKFQSYAAGDVAGDFVGGAANQQGANGTLAQLLAEGAVVAVFVFAAENDNYAAGEGFQGFQGGVHIGGFGVVVILNAGEFRHEFQAVIYSGERFYRRGDGSGRHAGEFRGGHGG